MPYSFSHVSTQSFLIATYTMSSFRNIDVKAPHIQQLQHDIQLQLARHNYSSEDDAVMAEYIVVMLANQKTAEQITAEMHELIGAEYTAAFTEWIWNATQRYLEDHAQAHADASVASSTAAAKAGASDVRTRTDNSRQRWSRSSPPSAASRAREHSRSRSPAHLNERDTSDHRRSRSPPQRRDDNRHHTSRDYSSHAATSSAVLGTDEQPFDGEAHWRARAKERRNNPPPRVHGGPKEARIFHAAYNQAVRNDANANRELFPDTNANTDHEPPPEYTPCSSVSIFGRAGIPDPRAPEFVPCSAPSPFASAQGEAGSTSVSTAAPDGKAASIFARIDPMLPNNQPLPAAALEPEPLRNHPSEFPTEPTKTSMCRWNVGCTNPMCDYLHASPANAGLNGDPNALVLSHQKCLFGARCINKDCVRAHVSPAVTKIQARQAAPVRLTLAETARTEASGPAAPAQVSLDSALPSQASSRPCRFGAACTRTDCFFSHPAQRAYTTASSTRDPARLRCRFGLGCTKPDCPFTHPPGQRAKAGATADRLSAFAQVSDDHMQDHRATLDQFTTA